MILMVALIVVSTKKIVAIVNLSDMFNVDNSTNLDTDEMDEVINLTEIYFTKAKSKSPTKKESFKFTF